MLFRWIPWKFIVKRAASAFGVMDPLTVLARLRRFAQPSEVAEPIELIRAGIVFHARGLINTRAIQHNLDWVWPYWVERQFNPRDPSFIPRAFSFSHVNLTHRNWTAVGLPGLPLYPIVDPRGLVTPLYDGWSIDLWLVSEDGDVLLPSRLEDVEQRLETGQELRVSTACRAGDKSIASSAYMKVKEGTPLLVLDVAAESAKGGHLVAALRPYNPEGVHFIEKVEYDGPRSALKVNERAFVVASEQPSKVLFSNYEEGDVIHKLPDGEDRSEVSCDVGMATAAALFPIEGRGEKRLRIGVPLDGELRREHPKKRWRAKSWRQATRDACRLRVPDERFEFLFNAAVSTLVLLSAHDAVPGPYTYRRFWFRDACFMLNALLALGFEEDSKRVLSRFPGRQKLSGYFRSQDGEWDSNGQVLWILDRFHSLTERPIDEDWMNAIIKGAGWIRDKRLPGSDPVRGGLLPAGFSAEHLGPNDYYYWDDFWGIAGLRAAARLAGKFHSSRKEEEFMEEARDFERAVFRSISKIPERRSRGAIPASPNRRMDAGAIGSLAADYPLMLTAPEDERISGTIEFLLSNCFDSGGFFQDMIHSGINAYLTLCIAQSLLRRGDMRYARLVESVADMASPTGQWPEAVHPITGGGCMGDGQHGWAAAEWVMMIRNMFVREEGDMLILGSGVLPRWLEEDGELLFGPTLTPFGPVSLNISRKKGETRLRVEASWRNGPPKMEARVPGHRRVDVTAAGKNYKIIKDKP